MDSTPASTFNSYDYETAVGLPEVRFRIELLRARLQNAPTVGRVLEVGLGAGEVTVALLEAGARLTCVDPSPEAALHLENRLGARARSFEFIEARAEALELPQKPEDRFDHIVLLGLLEHLEAPTAVLKHLRAFLKPSGRMHICVNLAGSLHRHVGLETGHIETMDALSDADHRLGHYRVYTPELLHAQLKDAGLCTQFERYFYLKPLPSSMMRTLPLEVHRAFERLGRKFPELASYIYLEVQAAA